MVTNETTFHIFCYLITKHVLKTQCEDVNNTYHAHVHVTGSCLRLNILWTLKSDNWKNNTVDVSIQLIINPFVPFFFN